MAQCYHLHHRKPQHTEHPRLTDPDHPLRKHNLHKLLPSIEYRLYSDDQTLDAKLDSLLPEPRLISTHIPFGNNLLPKSIVESECRIIYLYRNPKDTFVSLWHFSQLRQGKPIPLQTAFDYFCNGVSLFGPFWNHVLGYWNASLERPDKVLFVKYEELMEDTFAGAVRITTFIGFPFTEDQERRGVIEGIVKLCMRV